MEQFTSKMHQRSNIMQIRHRREGGRTKKGGKNSTNRTSRNQVQQHLSHPNPCSRLQQEVIRRYSTDGNITNSEIIHSPRYGDAAAHILNVHKSTPNLLLSCHECWCCTPKDSYEKGRNNNNKYRKSSDRDDEGFVEEVVELMATPSIGAIAVRRMNSYVTGNTAATSFDDLRELAGASSDNNNGEIVIEDVSKLLTDGCYHCKMIELGLNDSQSSDSSSWSMFMASPSKFQERLKRRLSSKAKILSPNNFGKRRSDTCEINMCVDAPTHYSMVSEGDKMRKRKTNIISENWKLTNKKTSKDYSSNHHYNNIDLLEDEGRYSIIHEPFVFQKSCSTNKLETSNPTTTCEAVLCNRKSELMRNLAINKTIRGSNMHYEANKHGEPVMSKSNVIVNPLVIPASSSNRLLHNNYEDAKNEFDESSDNISNSSSDSGMATLSSASSSISSNNATTTHHHSAMDRKFLEKNKDNIIDRCEEEEKLPKYLRDMIIHHIHMNSTSNESFSKKELRRMSKTIFVPTNPNDPSAFTTQSFHMFQPSMLNNNKLAPRDDGQGFQRWFAKFRKVLAQSMNCKDASNRTGAGRSIFGKYKSCCFTTSCMDSNTILVGSFSLMMMVGIGLVVYFLSCYSNVMRPMHL